MIAKIPAVLVRVSTDEQEEKGTIQIQTEFARKYCDLHGLPLHEDLIFADDGVSGTIPLEQRPGGMRLIEAAKRGEFNTLLIYKLDRLGRACRVILNAVDQLEQYGVTVVSMTEPFDTSNPFGRFVLTILAAVAEFERENILERTMNGRKKRANEGKWCGGPAPYGFQVSEEGFLIPEKLEAETVRWIFQHFAEEKGTLIRACQELNRRGVQTRKNGNGKNCTGKWTTSSIYGILINTAYVGTFRYGKEQVEQPCPALIDFQTWERAQRQVMLNREKSWRNASRDYWLSGLVKCNCGYHFSGHPRKNGSGHVFNYYICNKQRRAREYEGQPRCYAPSYRSEDMEAKVWEHIKLYAQYPDEIRTAVLRQQQQAEKNAEEWREGIKQLKEKLRESEGEKENVMVMFRKNLIDIRTVEKQFADIEEASNALREQIEGVEQQLVRIQWDQAELEETQKAFANLWERIKAGEEVDKREIARLLIKEIRVHSGPKPTVAIEDLQSIAYTYEDGAQKKGKPGKKPRSGWYEVHWKTHLPESVRQAKEEQEGTDNWGFSSTAVRGPGIKALWITTLAA